MTPKQVLFLIYLKLHKITIAMVYYIYDLITLQNNAEIYFLDPFYRCSII